MGSKTMIIKGCLLAIISGALLWISFPPFEFAPAAWVALVPLFIAVMRFAPCRWTFGLYYGIAFGAWFAGFIPYIPPDFMVLCAAPPVVAAIFFLLTFWQRNLLLDNNSRFFTAITVTSFVTMEFVRQYTPFAQFGSFGMTQYRHPEFIQIASWFGVCGVSAIVLLSNCAVALAVANIGCLGKVRSQLAINIVLIASLMGINLYLLNQPLPETGRVKVAAAQIGYVPEAKTHPGLELMDRQYKKGDLTGMSKTIISKLSPLTIQAGKNGAKLIVWPEETVGRDPGANPEINGLVSQLAVSAGAYLVVPYFSDDLEDVKTEQADYFNGARVFSPDGEVVFNYLKQHRITLFGIEDGFEGSISQPLDTPAGRLGIMICYDADFQDVTNAYVDNGADLLVVPSHDLSMFITRHHPGLLLFRAVERRRSMVKSDVVHGTMIIDPKGRILADPPDGLAMAEAEVPLVSVKTPFTQLSVTFGIGMVFAFVLFLMIAKMQKDKK